MRMGFTTRSPIRERILQVGDEFTTRKNHIAPGVARGLERFGVHMGTVGDDKRPSVIPAVKRPHQVAQAQTGKTQID